MGSRPGPREEVDQYLQAPPAGGGAREPLATSETSKGHGAPDPPGAPRGPPTFGELREGPHKRPKCDAPWKDNARVSAGGPTTGATVGFDGGASGR